MEENIKLINRHFTSWRNVIRSASTFGEILHTEKDLTGPDGETRKYECVLFNFVGHPLQCVYNPDDNFIRVALVRAIDEPANPDERAILETACNTLYITAIRSFDDTSRLRKDVNIRKDANDASRLIATMSLSYVKK